MSSQILQETSETRTASKSPKPRQQEPLSISQLFSLVLCFSFLRSLGPLVFNYEGIQYQLHSRSLHAAVDITIPRSVIGEAGLLPKLLSPLSVMPATIFQTYDLLCTQLAPYGEHSDQPGRTSSIQLQVPFDPPCSKWSLR